MTQELLRRRLILGPIMAAVSVFAISAMSKDIGWRGALLPSVLVGGLGSFGFAWYLVRSERPILAFLQRVIEQHHGLLYDEVAGFKATLT